MNGDSPGDEKNNDPPKTTLEGMLNVINGAGSIDPETPYAKTLLGLDEQKEMSALESRAAHLQMQNMLDETSAATAGAKDGMRQELTELSLLKSLVTPFVSIVRCEKARRLVQSATAPKTRNETEFLEAMKAMMTNTKSFEAADAKILAAVKAHFQIWKRCICIQLQGMTKSLYTEVHAQANQIEKVLFDNDRLTKPDDVEALLSDLRNWSGKADLLKALKTYQGSEGRGVKHFEAMISTLFSAGIAAPDHEIQELAATAGQGELGTAPPKPYRELYNHFINVRQWARLQLSLRSAALIIHAEDSAGIAPFEKDIKPLKVTIPKVIRDKLAKLKK